MTNTRGNRAGLVVAAILMILATAIASPAQTFKTLVSFDFTNGANPYNMALVQGTDGNLYGTTVSGGTDSAGTVFKVTPTGTLTTLHSFAGTLVSPADGAYPWAGLVLGTDGNFYGTTLEGGAQNRGTVFKMTSAGVVTVLYSFCSVGASCSDGYQPQAPLVQAASGIFYGTTNNGGTNDSGTVFSITSSGTLKTLYSFCMLTDCADGEFPEAALVQATSGIFYGTTEGGGAEDFGTVFSITAGGKLKTLHSFCTVVSEGLCLDGYNPQDALVQASNGTFYGTTPGGGNGTSQTGTVFSITAGGTLVTIYSFCSGVGCGVNPYAGLVQGINGNFFGTTNGGGVNDYGTVFEITASGELTTLHSFDNTDGYPSEGGNSLVQATNGTFYGTAYAGGADSLGALYSLADGFRAFVKTVPTSGKVGSAVTILGTKLTGATSVTFNGTAATFTVVSSTEITTTVPTGATTGKVQVVIPGTTLSSNVNFRVP
jgi:uncharacterized repeat protein (TIGR03803 family)